MFLDKSLLKRCLFVDIETVSECAEYNDLTDVKKHLWDLKAQQLSRLLPLTDTPPDASSLYVEKAGIFSEFAKVVCISMGFLNFKDDAPTEIKIKSLFGDDEKAILEDFTKLLNSHFGDTETSRISGHNIKEFDIPFLCRRLVVHQIPFPAMLDISGKKPWQTTHIQDTMDMWRFGDYKSYTSLQLLAGTLGIDSPKDDIDGSMVGQVYWQDHDLERIAHYCQKDVVTVAQIMLRYAGLNLIGENNIIIAN